MLDKLIFSALILGIAVIAFGCKSQKSSEEAEKVDDMVMIFGSSGGFAGKTLRYKLHEDGSIYKGGGGNTFAKVNGVDKDQAAQIFSNFNNLGFDRVVLDDPGNMTYFIIAKYGDRQKKLAWGGMNKDMPDNLEIYYNSFMKLMKRKNTNSSDM